MSGRNHRTHFDFRVRAGIEALDHAELLRLADVQIGCAQAATTNGDRRQALARLEAALEAIREARRRGDQLRL